MKNNYFKIIIIILFCFILISCKDSKGVTERELNKINNNIITNVTLNEEYENFVSSHVDKKQMKVIVDLKKNTKKDQTWFRKNIYNSDTIIFK